MAVLSEVVTLTGTTPGVIATGGGGGLTGQGQVCIQTSADIQVGGSDSQDYVVSAEDPDEFCIQLATGDELWGVAEAGAEVTVLYNYV
jgi:hypothetical protein